MIYDDINDAEVDESSEEVKVLEVKNSLTHR